MYVECCLARLLYSKMKYIYYYNDSISHLMDAFLQNLKIHASIVSMTLALGINANVQLQLSCIEPTIIMFNMLL